jgi:ankyrin repeat protein
MLAVARRRVLRSSIVQVQDGESDDARTAFLRAAIWHGSLAEAEAIRVAHPEIASADIHTAAVVGDDEAVRRFLAADPANAIRTSPPYGGDALVYLCLSKYLRLDPSRSERFLSAAAALLAAGANANTGFWTNGQHPEFETALYGAAGVAHHAAMTRLLLEHGADPNDVEAVYHSPETDDNEALKLLVETGRITAGNLAMMLIRKHDWHDYQGAKYLLERGADPNFDRGDGRGWFAIHHAIARDNDVAFIELLLDHSADPTKVKDGSTAIERAARRGRGDVLALIERRGIPLNLKGADRLIAACARNDAAAIRSIVEHEPQLVGEVRAQGGTLLAQFAGTANATGVAHLLDLGIPITAPYEGDGYFGVAKDSTALHVAAWRAWHDVVKLLIARGAPLDVEDSRGRTPLMLAAKACVDSYWSYRRRPDSVEALLRAGASRRGVAYPTGYDEIDALLRSLS